ncbi:MAG: hypothetical protein AB7I41_16595 [Candidatus Sericytochromatia bacterium]
MSKRPQLFSLGLTASLLMTGCTVDAQLASQLLSSLQSAAKSGTAKASISASLAATGQSNDDSVIEVDETNQAVVKQALQVACGGPGMRIASVQDDELTAEPTASPTAEPTATPTSEPTTEPTTEPTAEPTASPTTEPTATPTATAVPATEEVQPVVVALADPAATPHQKEARSRRLKIDAQLEVELRQMGKMKGSDRDRRFMDIQQRYPVMRNTVPVPVRARGQNIRQVNSTQIIFVQMPQMGFNPGRQAYPPQAAYRPGYASGGGYGTGGQGYFPQPRQGASAVAANRVKVSGKAILEGLGNLPCQGYAAPAEEAESTDSES